MIMVDQATLFCRRKRMIDMKRRLWIMTLLIIMIVISFFVWRYQCRNYTLSFSVSASDTQPVKRIRVGTYNIKLLDEGSGLKQFTKEIKEIDPDIICLQEVDQHTLRTGDIDMVKEMAKAAGYPYYHFYQSMWIIKGYYGIGILSKYPITEVSSTQLPNYILNEPRVLARAVIDLNGTSLNVYHSHLSFKERKVRNKQIEYISKEIENKENTIFMGDFNTFTASDFFEINGMTAISQPNDPYITFQDFGFPDNIYFSNNFHVLHVDAAPISFSDHHFFYCDLQLQ